MDFESTLKIVYKIFINLPYILTFLSLVCLVYAFIKKDDEQLFTYLFAFGFGLIAILSTIICFNLILPNMIVSEESNQIFNFINTVAIIIIKILIAPVICLGIVDLESTYTRRLTYILMPVFSLGLFFMIENICFRFI